MCLYSYTCEAVAILITPELGHGTIMKVYNGIGPIKIAVNGAQKKLVLNDINSITQNYHLLAIDFPCNTGFLNTTSSSSSKCPEYPGQTSEGYITFESLASTIADGLKDFFETKDPECFLHNMQTLKVFVWSEGFGSQLAINLKKEVEKKIPNFKLKGIILEDAIIDLKRQSQNFAAFGVGRSVISKESFREIMKLETNILLRVLTNDIFCNMYRNISSKLDPTIMCPFDLKKSCPSLKSFIGSTTNCDLFVADQIEDDPDNPLLMLLKDKMKVMRYQTSPSSLFWSGYKNFQNNPKLTMYDPDAINKLVDVLNDIPVLLYHSQNNMISNSIGSMLLADPLRWKNYEEYTSSTTKFVIVNSKDPKMKYSIRGYGNFNRAQIFDIGGLYTYRGNPIMLRDHIFADFTKRIT
jgi:Serine carboxypeptidase